MTSPTKGGGFGPLALAGVKLSIKAAMTVAMSNPQLVEYVAKEMARNETGTAWEKHSAQERAVWAERARSAMRALMDTVKF